MKKTEIFEFENEKQIIKELKKDPLYIKTYLNAGITFFYENKLELAEKYLNFSLFFIK